MGIAAATFLTPCQVAYEARLLKRMFLKLQD
jgi:hypothetical protein